MDHETAGGRAGSAVPWAGVGWWTVVGALAGFMVLALLSTGIFVLPLVLVLGAGGVVAERLRRGMLPGVLLGVSSAPFWMAWLNRSGPGTVCETTPTSESCAEQLSPWPFLVVGLVLVGAGAALVHRLVRTAAHRPVRVEVPGPS